MTLIACAVCGTNTNPGVACGNCGTPAPTETPISEASGYAAYWESMLEKLQRAAAPKYDVTGVLGYGGMAGVFRAHEPRLNRKVAIKVMSPALMMDPQLLERFVQEARTIAHLNHPNIVTIYEVDQRDDLHWFAMSYVAGRTLSEVMADSGEQLPIDVIGAWFYQIADALGYAHQQGVVHRDIKPGNVLLDLRGNALVTDFGIAKVADGESGGLTRTGMLVGTPTYMSPEQCTSGKVTGASDQYSLGAVIYQMLTGTPPFTGPTLAVIQAHVTQEPRPITELRPDCPDDLADAVHRMLEKRTENRWPTMSAAIAASGAYAPGIDDPVRINIEELAARPSAVTISSAPAVLREGQRSRLKMSVTDASGRELFGRRITWRSTQPAIAMVVGDDQLAALSPGSTHVMASSGPAQASFSITVEADPVREIVVKPVSASVPAGERITFDVDVLDLDGSRLDDRAVLWSSSDPEVVRVSATGEVEGIAPGDAMIAARSGGKYATARVTVTAASGIQQTPAPVVRPTSTRQKSAPTLRGTKATSRPEVGGAGTRSGAGGATRASSQMDVRTGSRSAQDTSAGESGFESRPQPARQLLVIAGVAMAALVLVVALVFKPWQGGDGVATQPDNAAPTATTASLAVGGNLPPGARVTAFDSANNGFPLSNSPTSLAAGKYTLEFTAQGYERQQTSMVLGGGQSETWTPELRAVTSTGKAAAVVADGKLSVSGVPAGGRVMAKDSANRLWAVTATPTALAPGRYTLEFTAQGYEPDDSTVVLRSGQTITWSPTVREVTRAAPVTVAPPAKGQISLTGDLPAGATVTARDSTGLTVILGPQTQLAPGTYTVEFRASGYEPDSRSVVVRSGQTQSFTPNVRPITVKTAPPVTRDVRADQASITTLVRDFVAAFNRRDTTIVLPLLLPQNVRANWRATLPSRDVTQFSATLRNDETPRVDGDAATVRFSVDLAFRNQNSPLRATLNFSGSAQRTASGWKLTALTSTGG